MASRAKRKKSKREDVVFAFGPVQVKPPPPGKLPEGDPKSLTEEEAIEMLWTAKTAFIPDDKGMPKLDAQGKIISNPKWCDVFVYASLVAETTFSKDVNGKDVHYTKPAGTRVLVTMVSRFGDVGIRDHHLVPPSNGYNSRVQPAQLTDWSTHP